MVILNYFFYFQCCLFHAHVLTSFYYSWMYCIVLSVLFRVHEGGNLSRKSETKVGGDSASCNIGEIIPFQELGDIWPISSK